MKKENGITLLVLVFIVIILGILTSITIYYSFGNNGAVTKASKTAFKQDINQIQELIDEKETTYRLERVTDPSLFTESVKRSILEEYYGKLEIVISISNGDVNLNLFYRPDKFDEEHIQWLQEFGIQQYKN